MTLNPALTFRGEVQFGHFVAGGQPEPDARTKAETFSREHLRRRANTHAGGFARIGSVFRSPSS
jgi:hypothetical protein